MTNAFHNHSNGTLESWTRITQHPTAASTSSAASSQRWKWAPGPTGRSGGVHLYYALGFLPHAGLREPLQKHLQSVLPALQRKGTADRYTETLNLLATEQQKASGTEPPHQTFDGWASQVLKAFGTGARVDTPLPGPPVPGDAILYAQGYLDQRRELQPNRPPPPPEEESLQYHWDYHLGRIMTWIGAGNSPNLTPGFRQGLADQRSLNPRKPRCPSNTAGNSLANSKAPGEPR